MIILTGTVVLKLRAQPAYETQTALQGGTAVGEAALAAESVL